MMARVRVLLAGAVVVAALAGCRPQRVPNLGFGPLRVDDPTVFDELVEAARSADHAPIAIDPEHGRFSVRARADATRATRFIVQCSRDGYVTVTPTWPRDARQGQVLDRALATELAQFVSELERTVAEHP